MIDAEARIREMVDRETRAWEARDAGALVEIFHRDMVWPWPPHDACHDPAGWTLGMGRYDRERWRRVWQELFDTHELVHNRRRTVRVAVTDEGDGGIAVVDVDTLWRRRDGTDFHWKGRACKGYTRVAGGWKLIFHTGLLDYGAPGAAGPAADGPGEEGR